MNVLTILVEDVTTVLSYFDVVRVFRSPSRDGSYTEITDSETRIVLDPAKTVYRFDDESGTEGDWYKTEYYNTSTLDQSPLSEPIQGGTELERIGWTFGNYTPPPGTWGKLYTADDMRYTMMFGVDSVGSDIAQSEFSDEQFDQLVNEAVGEFEAYLTMDIRRKKYVTNPSDTLVQSRYWRDGVDYTDEDDPYDFDPNEWNRYGFVQLRHYPVIKVTRAKWYSPVKGEIMDMIDNGWLRVDKKLGQLRMFPSEGFNYGPYAGAYGPLWAYAAGNKYPGAFEIDYETGFKSAEFVPEALRSVIAKYATIKALAVIGDGILAGFSSQSVSLDGLSESFSSTQSATSAYFGARIKQYSDEITEWLKVNRYKFAPIPISFVGV